MRAGFLEMSAKILVVDDDEGVREVISSILEEKGYDVDTAESGLEAIKKARTHFYNLALIDIKLPDMEGIELLTKMKKRVPRMRKIIITGYPSMQNAIIAVNEGADAYVTKPFDIEKVLRIVEDQLRQRETEKRYGQKKVTEFIETRVKELEKATVQRDHLKKSRGG